MKISTVHPLTFPVVATLRRVVRWVGFMVGVVLFCMVVLLLSIRFWFMPRLDDYRPRLEQLMSEALGMPVTVKKISGRFVGVRPVFDVTQLTLTPQAGATPLTLTSVSLTPAWTSLPAAELRLYNLTLRNPVLALNNDRQGRLWLNGILLSGGETDGRVANWLMRQDELTVEGARVSWNDERLGLAQLNLSHGELVWRNGWFGHKITLSATPPPGWLSSFSAQVEWRGDDIRRWREWSGTAALDLGGANVAPWQRYAAWLSHMPQGEGQSKLAIAFDQARITSANIQLALRNVVMRFDANQVPLKLPVLSGTLQLDRSLLGNYTLAARDLVARTDHGVLFDHASMDGSWSEGASGQGKLSLSRLDLVALRPLIGALPLGDNAVWRALAPRGFVDTLNVQWQGAPAAPRAYSLQGSFRNLAWQAVGGVPAVAGLTGSLALSEHDGQLNLVQSKNVSIALPTVFPLPLRFDQLDAQLAWQRNAQGTTLRFNHVTVSNQDLSADLKGSYHIANTPKQGDTADLVAHIARLEAKALAHYLPLQLKKDTRAWLIGAIKNGRAQDSTLKLSGDLSRFPFAKGGGVFSVHSTIKQLDFAYAPGWPAFTEVSGTLAFDNARMTVQVPAMTVQGINSLALKNISATIPDLTISVPVLLIDGEGTGPSADFINFLQKSPLAHDLTFLAPPMSVSGRGNLALQLAIPLSETQPTQAKGRYTFLRNQINAGGNIPPLHEVDGPLDFTEHGVSSPGIRLQALGGHSLFSAREHQKKTDAELSGDVDLGALLERLAPELASLMQGRTAYTARMTFDKTVEHLRISSSLNGVKLALPDPLGKAASSSMPLVIQWQNPPGAALSQLDTSLGDALSVRLWLDREAHISRGVARIGRAVLPSAREQTWALALDVPALDSASWEQALAGSVGTMGSLHDGSPLRLSLDLRTDVLTAYGKQFNTVSATLDGRDGHPWVGHVKTKGLEGSFVYLPRTHQLSAHLPTLALPLSSDSASVPVQTVASESRFKAHDMPALNIQIDQLMVQQHDVGRLTLVTTPTDEGWRLDHLDVVNPDGMLVATGNWRGVPPAAGQSEVQVSLNSDNLGKLLARVGEPDALVRGKGEFSGQFSWSAPLYAPDVTQLSGRGNLKVSNGMFAKIEPGVGRVLGLVSLQSLGRRLRLDFNDVFNNGFTFDSIQGQVKMQAGVLSSDRVQIKGPAADVKISGTVDFPAERQTLDAHVEPHLSESVAIAAGAVLLNPLVGAAAFAAQKVLQDPFGKLFSYDYHITGTFSEPQITRNAPQKAKTP